MSIEKAVALAVTLGTFLFTIYRASREFRLAREQRAQELRFRQRELRHKQALLARELIKEIMADARSRNALRMLDWESRDYTDDKGVTHRISRSQLQIALRVHRHGQPGFTPAEAYVRQCFESLYDQLEQLQNLIRLEIVTIEDVAPALRYYLQITLHRSIEHRDFLQAYDYPGVLDLLKHFSPPERAPRSIRSYASDSDADPDQALVPSQ